MIADISERETQEHLKRLTVLFVEDEEFSRELCSEFLSRIVGRLVTAPNGAAGLETWRQHKPDIIITDIQMPYMDGLAMVQEIRSADQAVPVIIMSAFDEPKYLKRGIDLGVSGYVLKPLEVSMFAATLLGCARGLLVAYKLEQANSALKKQNEFTQATLDGQSAKICVINAQGVIVTTNRAWNNFAVANDGSHDTCCRGINYLDTVDVNRVATMKERDDFEVIHAGINAVLAGTLPQFAMEYECSSSCEVCWFICRVNPFIVDDKIYAVISHDEITRRKLAEFALKARTRELDCLYSIISVSNAPGLSFEESFDRIARLIPPAWQFPEITEACIEIKGRIFQTALFKETSWKLTEDIIVEGNEVGKVTVCYLEEHAFLPEELTLLTAITEKLGLIVERELATETISRLAVTDELTDLNNRRFFSENFSKALSASQRHKQPLSLISIDLDHFKNVNDTFGHSVGDLVLKEFAQLLKSMVRFEDIACRMGGEEFMVLLPNTTCEASVALAERIRCSFEQLPRTSTPVVTASFGVAELQEDEERDALMTRVDAALYQAKHAGRNCVVAACTQTSF